jgi:hypothetical protein
MKTEHELLEEIADNTFAIKWNLLLLAFVIFIGALLK